MGLNLLFPLLLFDLFREPLLVHEFTEFTELAGLTPRLVVIRRPPFMSLSRELLRQRFFARLVVCSIGGFLPDDCFCCPVVVAFLAFMYS